MLQSGMEGELGLGPYSIGVLFALGAFLSTFAFNLFFMNLSVEGDPVEIRDYLHARRSVHLYGIFGGAIWCVGGTALLVASVVPTAARLSQPLEFGLAQGFTVVAAVWGLVVWKEFNGSDAKIKLSAAVMLFLYIAGVTLMSLAPVYIRKP